MSGAKSGWGAAFNLDDIMSRLWDRVTKSSTPKAVVVAEESSTGELKEMLDAIERALQQCNSVSDVGKFLYQVGSLVRAAFECRVTTTTTKTTKTTTMTTVFTTDDKEWPPEEFNRILEGIQNALQLCNDTEEVDAFLVHVGELVRKAMQCRATAKTTAAICTKTTCRRYGE